MSVLIKILSSFKIRWFKGNKILSNIYMIVGLFSYFSTINFDNRHSRK